MPRRRSRHDWVAMSEMATNAPVASKFVFLHDIGSLAPATKVRFLGWYAGQSSSGKCMTDRDRQHPGLSHHRRQALAGARLSQGHHSSPTRFCRHQPCTRKHSSFCIADRNLGQRHWLRSRYTSAWPPKEEKEHLGTR